MWEYSTKKKISSLTLPLYNPNWYMEQAKGLKTRPDWKKDTGRPTQYKEEYVLKADEYLAVCVDEEKEFHKTRWEKSDSYERYTKVKLPTVEWFAKFLGVATSTVNLRATQYVKFSEALDKIKAEQRERLLDKSLDWTYNPSIAKLILSHNHWIREQTEVNKTVTHKVEDLTDKQIEALAAIERLIWK